MILPPHPNEKLTDVIKRAGHKKLISIEVNPYTPIDYNIVEIINPSFCSVMWVVVKDETTNIKQLKPILVAKELIRRGYIVLVHLPGLFYTRGEVVKILSVLKEYGVRNIFALRGVNSWLKVDYCDFPFATELIKFIRSEFSDYFDIAIAGFPHVHPATRSIEGEMHFLRQKVLAGANIIMTQACLTSERYQEFKTTCVKYAIDLPVINAVLLMRSWNDFLRIERMSYNIDRDVLRNAYFAKRMGKGRHHGRNHTKNIIKGILNDELSAGLHIFTDNHLEIVKNLLLETNARVYQAHPCKRRRNLTI